MSDEITRLASVHLGKTLAGESMTPYVTPTTKDETLLVAVPRSINRTAYGIGEDFRWVGSDVWNCYETTFMLSNGFPVTGVTTICYLADTHGIVESKSLKLYLNSYNLMRFDTNEVGDAISTFEILVENDLGKVLETNNINVAFIPTSQDYKTTDIVNGDFSTLEDILDIENMSFDKLTESPEVLKFNETFGTVRYHSAVLRSNCRVTNQPDFGDVYIHIRGRKIVTAESLLEYLVSFRNENHFHEEVCEMIYKRLWDLLEPEELFVQCNYTRRGGIDINPVRASSLGVLVRYTNLSYARTQRQ